MYCSTFNKVDCFSLFSPNNIALIQAIDSPDVHVITTHIYARFLSSSSSCETTHSETSGKLFSKWKGFAPKPPLTLTKYSEMVFCLVIPLMEVKKLSILVKQNFKSAEPFSVKF